MASGVAAGLVQSRASGAGDLELLLHGFPSDGMPCKSHANNGIAGALKNADHFSGENMTSMLFYWSDRARFRQ
jgi:hypothetical protein